MILLPIGSVGGAPASRPPSQAGHGRTLKLTRLGASHDWEPGGDLGSTVLVSHTLTPDACLRARLSNALLSRAESGNVEMPSGISKHRD